VGASSVALAGIALITLSGAVLELDPLGVLLALGSSVAFSLQALSLSALGRRHSALRAVAVVFAAGTVLTAPLVWGRDFGWLRSPDLALAAVYVGVVTIAVAYALFSHGVKALTPAIAVTISLLEPVVAGLIGIGLLGDPLTLPFALGALLVVVGLAIVGRTGDRAIDTLV